MKKNKIYLTLLCIIIITIIMSVNAYASVISEDTLKAQVGARSGTEVGGNIFVWFLCAIAFLKVSQKIDSFMSSLGINVGNTGGSMLGEIMLATRGLSMIKNFGKKGAGGSAQGTGSQGSGQGAGFTPGVFSNMVGRNPANNTNVSNNNVGNQNAGNNVLNAPASQTNNALTSGNSGNNGNNAGLLPAPKTTPLLTDGGKPAGSLPECVVAFEHIYDKNLPQRRVCDYDNLELKPVLDTVAAFIMIDDSGKFCDVFHATRYAENDCTKITVMSKNKFREWVAKQ